MNEKVMVSPEIQSEAVVLPQIVSIKQASQRMGLPEYYIRRLCREVPGMAFPVRHQSGTSTLARWLTTSTVERQLCDLVKDAGVNCDILKN